MSVTKKFFENKNTKLTKSGKSMTLRIALEMLENGIEPNSKNIDKVFKKILATNSKNINEERNIVEGLLKPENIAKIKQKIANV
jgi:hypothetical protein